MDTPSYLTPHNNPYNIDSTIEIVYLMDRHRILTEQLGGLFPEGFNATNIHDILDIACGPGGWVLDVATDYQKIQVVGVDKSPGMVRYALAQAFSRGLDNTNFVVADMYQMAVFDNDTFDLVNACFISECVRLHACPQLLQEFLRVCRPGGMLRWTEGGAIHTSSHAYREWLKVVDLVFTGARCVSNISPIMDAFLRNTGCVDVQEMVFALDFSIETPVHMSMYRIFDAISSQMLPFLAQMGIYNAEELEQMRQQVIIEMLSDGFCAVWPITIVWGRKLDPRVELQ